jgi:tetratricopeptide (TPR) repeat protein
MALGRHTDEGTRATLSKFSEVTCLFSGKLNNVSRSMLKPFGTLSLVFLVLASALAAQAPQPKFAASTSDNSQEAFVIEQFILKDKFENDGTSSREQIARVRIQSEAGVQRYGLLSFSYPSATGTFELVYVRVRKPDGSVVETPPENVQDMAAEITRQAPFYSDLHEKHVAVKGLSVGDTLEFRTNEHTTKPLAPGHFWTAYQFTHDVIVLDEQVVMSVPQARAIKIKSTTIQPVVTEADGYRTYTWRSSNLQNKNQTDEKREATKLGWQQMRGRVPQPDVLVSSFASWEEVGKWYGGLQKERVKPSPEITAKAAELTKNSSNDEAKLRAIYGYVSTQFHYIGVSFGIGRYQPHSAAEVLANQYGDCKDKHTLLASLLTAAGIPAYPALISSTHEIDADVPSPGQFDHVITVVPRESGPVWLDTTAEVGPYQYLVSPLRDKHALAVWSDKPADLVSTPADLLHESTQTFNMDAKLNDAGTLEGKAEFSARGDLEFLLRSSFRAVPLPQWKDLGQQISLGFGFGGEVSEVTASAPEKTDELFHFSYKYTRKEYGDWPNRQIMSPAPGINLLAPSDEEHLPMGPLWLGPLLDLQFNSRVELPGDYRPQLPVAIHLNKDFAQYDATYDFKHGQLIGERHLKTLMREVPSGEREEYKQFVKVMQDDYGKFIPLSSGSESFSTTRNMTPLTSIVGSLRNLPNSSNEEAIRLETEASDALTKQDMQTAVSSLYRAVSADPKFARAWVTLGSLLLSQRQTEAGMDAFHKAMQQSTEAAIPKALGTGLMFSMQFSEAIPVWQDYAKAHPEDQDGPANLGLCLMQMKRYSEAAAAYESAAKTTDRADVHTGLASAYLLAGEPGKAALAYKDLADLDPKSSTLNNAAFEMTKAGVQLPVALEYAQKAARAAEGESLDITLEDLRLADLRRIEELASYWDTLGWVNGLLSNFEPAEEYLQASWKLTQSGTAASHLCQVYELEHKTAAAIRMCNLALERLPLSKVPRVWLADQVTVEMDETRKRLQHLSGGSGKSNNTVDAAGLVVNEDTFKLLRFLPGTESAEFFVLLSSDGKNKTFQLEDTKFISGSAKMKPEGKRLKSINFNFPAPSGAPAHVVRRGILGCYQYSGCSFVLLDPGSVNTLN